MLGQASQLPYRSVCFYDELRRPLPRWAGSMILGVDGWSSSAGQIAGRMAPGWPALRAPTVTPASQTGGFTDLW